MIDRPLISPANGIAGSGVTSFNVDTAYSETNPDGSMDIYLDEAPGEQEALAQSKFEDNLAELLDETTLMHISNDLQFVFQEDKQSRREWEEGLAKGMDLLGIKDEARTTPWQGACGVTHPMILEAAVRFQSKTITRMFPPTGPANVEVMGASNEWKIQQAKRVANDLNYWLTQKMKEFRDETEQLLFAIPIDGSGFKKVFFDPILQRPVSQFVPAHDFVMPYGFPNLETTPRYTHVLKKAYGDILHLQGTGFYRNIPLQRGVVHREQLDEAIDTLSGMSPSYAQNELVTLWEVSTNLAIEGESRPYIVTLETDGNKILSIYRNWRENDPLFAKILSFVHYRYVPWKGPYGLGLLHLIGGIGHSATSILRQLVDAGTLSNLPGGMKSRQLRIQGTNDPIHPGEWRDVDVPAGKISESIFPMPYKEPSNVLFELLKMLVDEGKSFASIAELDISTNTQQAPVGTTLALIERATEVITAVQSRMHIALAVELYLIYEIIRDNTPKEYDYDPPNGLHRSIKQFDYQQPGTIIPVSDPASSTMAQRVLQYQAAIQLSAQAPQLYDLPLLHRSMLEVLGIDAADQIVPDKTAAQPMDPVAENMALMTSKPVKAFEWQNHQAHLQTHMGAMNDPSLKAAIGQNPLGPSIVQAAWAHVQEHMAYAYRQQIEQHLGTPLPPLGEKLPPEVENQLSTLVAQAAQKLLQANQTQAQQQQAQQQMQDPIMQQQQAELQIRAQQVQQRGQSDQQRNQLEQVRIQQKGAIEAAKIQSQERMKNLEIQAENARHSATEIGESHRAHMGEHAETTRALMQSRVDQHKNLIEHHQNQSKSALEAAKVLKDAEQAQQEQQAQQAQAMQGIAAVPPPEGP